MADDLDIGFLGGSNDTGINFANKHAGDSLSDHSSLGKLKIPASDLAQLNINSDAPLSEYSYTQDGAHLLLEHHNGQDYLIEGYFNAPTPPLLKGINGEAMPPKLVKSFLINQEYEYAQDTSLISDANGPIPVGQITEAQGDAYIIRTSGDKINAKNGTLIFQNDVIETGADGAVNIVFADESSFAVSDNARLAIDEFIFDPTSLEGISNFSMLRGVFIYSSGQIGASDPDDVQIDTPIGSIGIRGTIIAGRINPKTGDSEITVLEGAIVVRNETGEIILTNSYETVRLSDMDSPIEHAGQIPSGELSQNMQGVSGVAGGVYNALRTQAAQEQQLEQGQKPQADAQSGEINTQPNMDEPTQNKQGESKPHNGVANKDGEALGDSPASDGQKLTGETKDNGTGNETGDNNAPSTKPSVTPTTLDPSNTDNTGTDINLGSNGNVTGPAGSNSGSGSGSGHTGGVNISPAIGGGESGEHGGTTTQPGQPTSPPGSDFTPTNPDVINPPAPPPSAPLRLDLNAPATQGNIHHVINLENGSKYGATVTSVYNTSTGFSDIVMTRGEVNSSGNFVVINGAAAIANVLDMTGASYKDITDAASPNTNNEYISSVAVGDYNHDGSLELIFGTPRGYQPSSAENDGFIHSTKLDGSGVATITTYAPTPAGDTDEDLFGYAVANLGDLDNDGNDDFGYTTPGHSAGTGSVTVVMDIISSLSGGTSYSAAGSAGNYIGSDITGLGDMNGDGYDDYAYGVFEGTIDSVNVNSNIDSAFILLGGNSPFAYVDFSDALRINGDSGFGRNIESVGDINGDGLSDIMIGDGNQALKIILGSNGMSSGTTQSESSFQQFNIDLSASGYEIESAHSAGDFNADGLDDIAVYMRDGADIKIGILFGNDSLAGKTYSFEDINENSAHALMVDYELNAAPAGHYELDIAAGDFNGDGFDDIIITDPEDDQAFIIEGGQHGHSAGRYIEGNNISANSDNKILTGTAGNDVVHQAAKGNLSIQTGAGNDQIHMNQVMNGSTANFMQVDGGGGDNDRLVIDGVQASIDFSNFERNTVKGIENITLDNGNDLILSVRNIYDLLKNSDNGELKIESWDVGSSLTISEAGAAGSTTTDVQNALSTLSSSGSGHNTTPGFDRYVIGEYQLFIDNNISFNTVI